MIGLDEGQFFGDVVEFAEDLANLGKSVVIAALDGTYQRGQFNRILELVPLAEHVVKLRFDFVYLREIQCITKFFALSKCRKSRKKVPMTKKNGDFEKKNGNSRISRQTPDMYDLKY